MFVRETVAKAYAASCANNSLKKLLDRSGASLASYGDFDIAFTACDMGLGMGKFISLKLTHLIPASRTTPEYCLKIREDSSYSEVLFRFARGEKISPPSRVDEILRCYRNLRMRLAGRETEMGDAAERGKRRAIAFLQQLENKR